MSSRPNAWARHLVLGLLALASRRRAVSRQNLQDAEALGILVVRQDDRIGNLLFITPLLAGLRRQFPRAAIDVASSSKFGEVLEYHPAVRSLIPVDRRRLQKGPLQIVSAIRTLRRRRYDLVIDCKPGPSLSNTLAVLLARGTHRLGFAHEYSTRLYSHTIDGESLDRPHESERLYSLVGAIWDSGPCGPMEFHFPPDRLPRETREGVSMHIGGHGAKRVPMEVLTALITALRDRDYPVALLSGPDDEERAREIEAGIPGQAVTRPADVIDLARHIAESRVFVGPDTGALHIASALDVPIVNLFPGRESVTFGPRSRICAVVDFRSADVVDQVLGFVGTLPAETPRNDGTVRTRI